jgi:hypothetical protein
MSILLFILIVAVFFSCLCYMLYLAIHQQYSDKRFLFRSLGALSAGFIALLGYSPYTSSAKLFLMLCAYVVLALAVVVLVLAKSKFFGYLRSSNNDNLANSEPEPVFGPSLSLQYQIEREQLGHVLALRLIMADDSGYGLEEYAPELSPKQADKDDLEGWHPEYHAFLGKYGMDEEPFIYFYYPNATEFLNKWDPKLVNQSFPNKKTRLIVEEIDDEQRKQIEDANIKIRTFSEITESQGRLISYKKWLRKSLEAPVAITHGPKIIDSAVPLSGEIREIPEGNVKETIDDVILYILDWVKDGTRNTQVIILGEYGQGKSVLSLKLSFELIQNFHIYRRIPILIELGVVVLAPNLLTS